MEVQTGQKTTKARGKPFQPGQVANPNGRKAGVPNKFTRELKEAILSAAEQVGSDGKGEGGLQGFLLREALKPDNRGFMSLLGRVLPLQIVGDKNRPLEIVTRVELVKPPGADAPRVVNPRPAAPVIDGKAKHVAGPPPLPVRVKPPGAR